MKMSEVVVNGAYQLSANPKSVVTVSSILAEDGTIAFAALGGGFVWEVPLEAFLRDFQPWDATKDYAVLGTVGADWLDEEVPAYVKTQRWNGWAIPYFTKDQVEHLKTQWPDMAIRYDEAEDAYVTECVEESDEPEMWKAIMLATGPGQEIKVYSIGGGSWCWDATD